MTPQARLSKIAIELGISLTARGIKALATELSKNTEARELRDTVRSIKTQDISDVIRDIVIQVTK